MPQFDLTTLDSGFQPRNFVSAALPLPAPLSHPPKVALMADLLPPEAPTNGITEAFSELPLPSTVSKRQRRPSVRLGDIGEQPTAIAHEHHHRRPKKWNASSSFTSEFALPAGAGARQPSMTRPLSYLRSDEPHELSSSPTADRGNLETTRAVGISRLSREGKGRRGELGVAAAEARLVRPSWSSKTENDAEAFESRSSGGEDAGDDAYEEYDELRRECSECPSNRRPSARVKFPEIMAVVSATDSMEREAPSEMDGSDWHDQNGRCQFVEDGGVRLWLDQMGLGRYAPVFDIHEVDEEVLPLLTLEDLKDMGISAVGSRRKMYSAIQKLRKSLS